MKNILFYTDEYACANLIIKKAENNSVKVYCAKKGDVFLDFVTNVIDFARHSQNADEIISDVYIETKEKESIKTLSLIQNDPIYRRNFFNLCGVKNDETVRFNTKEALVNHIRTNHQDNYFVFKKLDYAIPAKSAHSLIEFCELNNSYVVAKFIKGIPISVYKCHDGAYMVFKYKDGFVGKKLNTKESKVYKSTIEKVLRFLPKYDGVLRFDTINNTSGTYLINVKNGVDKYYSIIAAMGFPDEVNMSKVFFTKTNDWHLIVDKDYYNKIYVDNNITIMSNLRYYRGSLFLDARENIRKIDDFNDMFCPQFYIRKFEKDYNWVVGQKVL